MNPRHASRLVKNLAPAVIGALTAKAGPHAHLSLTTVLKD